MKEFFYILFYNPIYNALVFLINTIPYGDLGIAIIILTISIRVILFPLSHKSTTAQAKMRVIEPEIKEIQEKHKDNKEEMARKMMDLYKKHGVSPLSGCLPTLLQLPVMIALYYVLWGGLKFNENILYSFILLPDISQINVNFLGIVNLTDKSIFLAVLSGVTQFYQMKLSIPPPVGEPKTAQEEFMRSMGNQMKYVFPVMITFISYSISGAVALYWTTSNVFSIAHEFWVRKKAKELLKAKK